jgi:hypothetical protein
MNDIAAKTSTQQDQELFSISIIFVVEETMNNGNFNILLLFLFKHSLVNKISKFIHS